jgi:hypothetical protein
MPRLTRLIYSTVCFESCVDSDDATRTAALHVIDKGSDQVA